MTSARPVVATVPLGTEEPRDPVVPELEEAIETIERSRQATDNLPELDAGE